MSSTAIRCSLRPPFQHEKPTRRAPIPQRSYPPDMPRRRSNRSPHRPKIEFPIDQCLLTAGSFIRDFRTPAGARNSFKVNSSGLLPIRFLSRSRAERTFAASPGATGRALALSGCLGACLSRVPPAPAQSPCARTRHVAEVHGGSAPCRGIKRCVVQGNSCPLDRGGQLLQHAQRRQKVHQGCVQRNRVHRPAEPFEQDDEAANAMRNPQRIRCALPYVQHLPKRRERRRRIAGPCL